MSCGNCKKWRVNQVNPLSASELDRHTPLFFQCFKTFPVLPRSSTVFFHGELLKLDLKSNLNVLLEMISSSSVVWQGALSRL